jgi:outer membrane protein TolC
MGFMGAYEINDGSLLGASGSNWMAMVTVGVNVFDGRLTASRVRQSREERARAESLVSGFESQVVMEVRQAHAELQGAFARREAARGAVAQAEEGLRIVRDRYENGLGTVTDLLDGETALTDARARLASAAYDCRNGAAALDLATGTPGETPEEARR